ncbi:MAG: hypothetical protein HYX27_03960 [Acidobacteria bacterium]|nr:hypothetical protein [Acidobacteriota bacterium]
MPLLPPNRLRELRDEVAHATKPATHVERWFANQAAYAAWELERVRANKENQPAEPRLNAAYSRAARNWNRARKELQSLQAARTSHATHLKSTRRQSASATPLANAARVPQPKLGAPMVDHAVEMIAKGRINSKVFSLTAEQEGR